MMTCPSIVAGYLHGERWPTPGFPLLMPATREVVKSGQLARAWI